MVVDDEKDITEVLKVRLEESGFLVDAFNDPLLALSALNGRLYDLAIFDIRMPRMTGFELFREFRRRGNKSPVCFLTAFDINRNEFEKLFPGARVALFIKKSVRIPRLVSLINEAIDDGSVRTEARYGTKAKA